MPLSIKKSPASKKCELPKKSANKLPATVLCGFLGSGKTTLLNYILNNQHGYRIAIIVNDMSEISIDAATLKQGQAMLKRTEEKFVEMSNGCICCTLRSDLVKEVSRLAKKGKFDYLIIESTGMAEPLPIAQAFSFETDHGKTLYDIAKIDTMVTVVDAFNFFKELGSIETHSEVKSTGKDNQVMQEIPIAQLFIDQIEFATVIIINKTDLVTAEQLKSVEDLVRRLNPKAELMFAERGVVPIEKIINTKKFDFEEAQNTAKWIAELAKAPSSEVEEYGISSFAYKRRKPFNPDKLFTLMNDHEIFSDVIRGKGYIWIATNMITCASINIVSGNKILEPETIWWAAIKQSKWGNSKKEIDLVKRYVKDFWEAKYGDRRNEMIFIGRKMNKDEIVKRLDECLLTDEEFACGEAKWKTMFKDPFVEWQKAAQTHPLKENFKYVEDEWEEVESDEEDITFNVTNTTNDTTRSTNASERSDRSDLEEDMEDDKKKKRKSK